MRRVVPVAVVAALSLTAAGRALGSTVAVFPSPGDRVAGAGTQITFRGVPIAQLGSITVKGRVSGSHSGRLVADSDGQGGSFIPARQFAHGERVTVSASGVSILGGKGSDYSFITSKPGPRVTLSPLYPSRRTQSDVQAFKSRADLTPPAVSVLARTPSADTEDVFVAPQNGPLGNYLMLLDQFGRLVYAQPAPSGETITDFQEQSLNGQPVLTWWHGKLSGGIGLGTDVIYDTRYQPLATVHAGNGFATDLHEFQLTDHGTALVTAYQPVLWDTRSIHGSSQQDTLDCVVQEIDIKTGLVLFEWHSLDHVPVTDSHSNHAASADQPYDYFHINSIQQDTDGTLVVSGRDTWAGYKLDHSTGAIIWTLGGDHSSFAIPKSDQFAWQHDFRVRPGNLVTVYDNGAGDQKTHTASRGEVLALDFTHHTARETAAFVHNPRVLSSFEGNTQVLPNGDFFVGSGQYGYATEYSPGGRVQFDMRFADGSASYRGYRSPWAGVPVTQPAIAARSGHGRTGVYASWNGAQNVAAWRILAGSSASRLSTVATTANQGFETRTSIRQAAYVSAQPLDASGRVLGRAKVIRGG